VSIGERIRSRRKELKLTQRELAVKMGYKDHTTIARIENGKVEIVHSKLMEFAKALEVTSGYLIGLEDNDILFPDDIGNRIKRVREDRNMTLDELSTLVGITVDYAYAIENGMNRTIKRELITNIAHVLNISESYFLSDNKNVDIGKNMECLRLMSDITISDMSNRINAGVDRIMKVENGTPPTLEEIERYANFFNIPKQWITNLDFSSVMNDERIRLALQILAITEKMTKEQREQVFTYARFILSK
ncbi:MAG: helix-turn-helix transcriptional regulator, partial [Firmicutes bacterium]|nr:helix-turn-helix transcriptional regulator [Bacillota bacterium]